MSAAICSPWLAVFVQRTSITSTTSSRAKIASAPLCRPGLAGSRGLAGSPAGGGLAPPPRAAADRSDFKELVLEKNATNPVVVYSKTYCPYCAEVKGIFQQLQISAKVVELDELADGSKVQEAVAQLTGRRTVPQVFIGGKHVGGCDDTLAAKASGQLKQLLQEAGLDVSKL